MIKNLIFDFGRVLVDYDFFHIIDTMFTDKEAEQEFCSIFVTNTFIDRCDREDIPFIDIIRETQAQFPQFRTELQAFYDRYPDFVTGEVPHMAELLAELKEKGYKLYGLSNWCSKVYDIIPRYSIFNLLDGYVVSSDVHLIKPDTAIYHCLCEKYGLKPEECLFADDKMPNIIGARNAGMEAVLFTDAHRYAQHLRESLNRSLRL